MTWYPREQQQLDREAGAAFLWGLSLGIAVGAIAAAVVLRWFR